MASRPSTSPGPAALPGARALLAAVLLRAALLLLLGVGTPPAALATPPPPGLPIRYSCDGDLLVARIETGAVDAPGVPNSIAGTPPGAFVVIDWRGQHLQLPRTNNAGAPSFTDGRWWWGLADPDRPELRLRRGDQVRFACEVLVPASSA